MLKPETETHVELFYLTEPFNKHLDNPPCKTFGYNSFKDVESYNTTVREKHWHTVVYAEANSKGFRARNDLHRKTSSSMSTKLNLKHRLLFFDFIKSETILFRDLQHHLFAKFLSHVHI